MSSQPSSPAASAAPKRARELRVFGVNACHALFKARPDAVRKVYVTEVAMRGFRELIQHCVAARVGYRVVADDDLERLTQSTHHEGIAIDSVPRAELAIDAWVGRLDPRAATVALWLVGVGNPHNFGAILRSAAHFGAGAVLLDHDSNLRHSGAALRVAEGGGEAVEIVRVAEVDVAHQALAAAGFETLATSSRSARSLFAATLPKRAVFLLGAEGQGLPDARIARADQSLVIPGSGLVDSLNVASSASVLLAEHWRRRHLPGAPPRAR